MDHSDSSPPPDVPSLEGVTSFRWETHIWENARILELMPDATRVETGDCLIRLDSAPLERLIGAAQQQVDVAQNAFSASEEKLRLLEENALKRLTPLRQASVTAHERHVVFSKIRGKSADRSAKEILHRSEQLLANKREELDKLEHMEEVCPLLAADDIVLQECQDDVAASEFCLRMEMLNQRRILDVVIPREASRLEKLESQAVSQLGKAEAQLAARIASAKQTVAIHQEAHGQQLRSWAELIAERPRAQVIAPCAGWFHHMDLALGMLPTGRAVAVFIPDSVAARAL